MANDLLTVLLSGISLGSTYAVMAVGMTLVYGVSRVFNFAYGSFFVWGAYASWLLFSLFAGISYVFSFLAVLPILFFFGLVVERGIIRALRKRANWQVTTMMITLGLALFMDNSALAIFGPFGKSLPPLFSGTIVLASMRISKHEIATLLFSLGVIVFLGLFLKRTRLGMAMRAVAQDKTGAQIVGIAANSVFGIAFAIATTLSGIAGILLAPKYFIFPLGGWEILVKAWVVVTFGGLGSTKGTLYSAFILGIVEALVSWQIGGMWVMVVWFSILLGIQE